jgi:predicted transcriptional regulator
MGNSAMNNEVVDPHLTTRIVTSYVRHHAIGASQLSDLIITVHRSLGRLGQPVQTEEVRVPAVSARQSVRHEYVVCLDCGYRGKTLRRHISTRHGLSRDEYLKRWELLNDHPLTAPAYTERRSILAKELGLGRKPKTPVASAVTPTAPAPANADQMSEVTPAPTPIDADQGSEVTPAGRRRSRAASNPEVS